MITKKRSNFRLPLLVGVLILLANSFLAQQRQDQGPPQIPNETQINKMVENLSTELLLNDTQKTEILALYLDHFDEVKTLMKNGQRPSREDMENMKDEFEDEVKSLLNDEQNDKFDEFRKSNDPQKKYGGRKKQNKR